jgi:hypothetical protein
MRLDEDTTETRLKRDLEVIQRIHAWHGLTPLEFKIWSRVSIIEDDHSCWDWRGDDHEGCREGYYPHVSLKLPSKLSIKEKISTPVSRVVLLLVEGSLPEIACHHCDRPPCCRPGHLYNGTAKTNGEDRSARGRARNNPRSGEEHGRSVLTKGIVNQARIRARNDEKVTSIAVDLSVNPSSLMNAVRGVTWKESDMEPPVPVTWRRGRLTADQIREIRIRAANGTPREILSAEFSKSLSMISAIVTKRAYPTIGD